MGEINWQVILKKSYKTGIVPTLKIKTGAVICMLLTIFIRLIFGLKSNSIYAPKARLAMKHDSNQPEASIKNL
jgi:hypothetical protein